ncbi:uroporphyrinogen decarboxylase family protein [Candidatus Solincola tengchongensis]|uniref:uroporphyrinogen decarboxylase family protein n=1 Tax=Candidatus Solincola tengchongensis TaxID=2900693 RepID=UPI00257D4407|nr:uroporphyrinogen decarboxylase family protein [Candidatus Solincola tengchongensis]
MASFEKIGMLMGNAAKLGKAVLYSRGLHMGGLDGYQRVIAGIYGTPDRVPLIVQPYTYAMAMHGIPARIFFTRAQPFIHASWNMASYFGFDFWSPVFDFYNIELEALGQKLIWREGSEPDVDSAHPLIGSETDFRRLRPPVPGKDGRMPFVLEAYKRYMEIMRVPPMVYACSPFTMAVLIRGYVNIIRDMRRNPDFVHRIMEFLSMEVVVPWIHKMAEVTNTSLVVMSDAWASQPNMTTEMVREFCLPYVEKVIRATSSPLRTVLDTGSWGEGSVRDPLEVLEIKMRMILQGNPFPSLRPLFLLVWNEDYEAVGIPFFRRYADSNKVCLMLNFRPELIETIRPEHITDRVCAILREGAGKGRFVLLVNLVPVESPVENVRALVEAVRRFGAYPIREDLEPGELRLPPARPFAEWVREEGLPV